MSQHQTFKSLGNPAPFAAYSERPSFARTDDIVDLRRFLVVIWQRKSVVFAFLVAGVLLGALYAFQSASRYAATATLLVAPAERGLLIKQQESEPRLDGYEVDNHVEIIQSSNTLARAFETLMAEKSDLEGRSSSPSARLASAGSGSKKSGADPAPAATADALSTSSRSAGQRSHATEADGRQATSEDIEDLKERFRVLRRRDTHLIDITFRSYDPKEAARLANGLAQLYIAMQLEARVEEVRKSTHWMAALASEFGRATADSEKRVELHKAQHNLLDPEALTSLEKRLSQTNERLALSKSKVDAIAEQMRALHALQSLDRIEPAKLKALRSERINEILDAFTERAASSNDGNASNPIVTAELPEAQRHLVEALGKELSQLSQSVMQALRTAQAEAQRLEVQKAELQSVLDRQTDAAIKLKELTERAAADRAMYNAIDTRNRELVAQQTLLRSPVRLVAKAIEPTKPASMEIPTLLALATLASAILGVGAALVLEHAKPIMRSLADVEAETGLTPLALVERARVLSTDPFAPLPKALDELCRVTGWHLGVGEPADAGRIVAFASAEEGEGKSVLAAAFAAHFARHGLRVLLVDASLRNPTLTRIVQESSVAGAALSDFLLRGVRPDLVPVDCAQGSKLSFAPAIGRSRSGQAAPMLTARLADLLASLRSDFDLIVLDTTALLHAVDSRCALQCCDKTLLVVRRSATAPSRVRAALQMSRMPPDRFAGVLLNEGGRPLPRMLGRKLHKAKQLEKASVAPTSS
jgi:succinoglycan biosynthesis transport protein ExoP